MNGAAEHDQQAEHQHGEDHRREPPLAVVPEKRQQLDGEALALAGGLIDELVSSVIALHGLTDATAQYRRRVVARSRKARNRRSSP
jgi:hypothetical protein